MQGVGSPPPRHEQRGRRTWSLGQDAQVGQRNGGLVKALKKQQSVPGWDGSVWTRTGVPALGTGDVTTQREGKHRALQSPKEFKSGTGS